MTSTRIVLADKVVVEVDTSEVSRAVDMGNANALELTIVVDGGAIGTSANVSVDASNDAENWTERFQTSQAKGYSTSEVNGLAERYVRARYAAQGNPGDIIILSIAIAMARL